MRNTFKRQAWRATALGAAIASSLTLSAPQGYAQVVGTIGAVNPLSLGTPPGEKTRNLILGARVITNELIQTSGEGSANITFLDRTTMSIGRNSTLIIDKYVYDPGTGKGVLTATMAQGVLRFIGGQISHSSGVKVLTPVATIGVRGGMMTVNVGADGVSVMSHYGHIDVANGRSHQLILRSGFTVHVRGHNDDIGAPGRTSLQALDKEYQTLSGHSHHRHQQQQSMLTNSTAAQYGLANEPLPNDPDSMPGLDTLGTMNLGQDFVGNRSQQQQWNGAYAALPPAAPVAPAPPPVVIEPPAAAPPAVAPPPTAPPPPTRGPT